MSQKELAGQADFTWVVFDLYGSLIDWEGGMTAFLYALALRSGDDAPPRGQLLFNEWSRFHGDLRQEPFRPHKDVLSQSLRSWCQRLGYEWNDSYGGAAKTAVRSFQPFPEALPVLRRAMDNGQRLGLLVDSDHDIMNHTLNQLPIEFEEVVVSEDCQAYKPSAQNFARTLQQTGVRSDAHLYIATDLHSDIIPAHAAGMRTAWINRKNAPLAENTPSPDYVWRDLWNLVGHEDPPEVSATN